MDIRELIINDNISILEAIKQLDTTGYRILMVADEDNKLKGVITDGDVRRWLLKNGDLQAKAKEIVNYHPKFILENERENAYEFMKKNRINSVPIVNIDGEIVSIINWNEANITNTEERKKINVPVVIMAGGLGTRLYPYTKILPKPLIPIGDIPIVERIINKFNYFGCNEFFLTVNYKKNMIKSYFGDIEKNYEVSYIEEEKALGTGGSLYLLKGKVNDTFFLSNCDIIVDCDYRKIYEFHKKEKNLITMVCAMKNSVIPYGVIKLDKDGSIKEMTEKPEYSFLTNTGMYIVEASVLDDITEEKFMNFPDLIQKNIDKGNKVGVYPITENCWMDMGQPDEMREMIEKLANN